ncbi:hypothetical protein [Methanonatronarchaeum sp. AMET-Sl]|uniref:hypothetical protein n=1 Tax=Methanonatronarchaeum sp. AMET-Sl TaxID=3037654 RepID=UPI00244E54A1|nr:hypothetical protein [Methanonatronarchaeum sp. AMET-Sl]WGI17391.1 hypothetical protein QEN48_07780 [Methanonatronarchaeum sp. AMET-Sl]
MSNSKWRNILVLFVALVLAISATGCLEEETMDEALEVNEIFIEQAMALSNEEFTIEASVTNTENRTGDYTVILEKEDEVIKTSTISLSPGETKSITFEHKITETGLYNLTIGNQSTEIRIVEGEIETLDDIKTLEFKTTINDSNKTHVMIEDPATEELKIKINIEDQDITGILNLEDNVVEISSGALSLESQVDLDEVEDIEDLIEVFEDFQTLFGFFGGFETQFDEFDNISNIDMNETNDLINETELNQTDLNQSIEETLNKFVEEFSYELFNAEDPYDIEEISFKCPSTETEVKIFDIKVNEGLPENTFTVYA